MECLSQNISNNCSPSACPELWGACPRTPATTAHCLHVLTIFEQMYRWWYTGTIECLSQNIGNNCSMSAVDRAWRQYFRLLFSVRETTSTLSTLNFPVMEQVLMCPPGKQGQRWCSCRHLCLHHRHKYSDFIQFTPGLNSAYVHRKSWVLCSKYCMQKVEGASLSSPCFMSGLNKYEPSACKWWSWILMPSLHVWCSYSWLDVKGEVIILDNNLLTLDQVSLESVLQWQQAMMQSLISHYMTHLTEALVARLFRDQNKPFNP